MNIKVIDISYYQDPAKIDYDALCGSVDGIILRSSYGTGASAWQNQPDPAFETHYAEIKKRGVPLGTYHFIVEYKSVDEQLSIVKKALDGKTFELGYWADVELEGGAEALTRATVVEYMTKAEAFFGELGIYTGAWCWNPIMGNSNPYATRKLWVGSYTTSPYLPIGWSDYWLWQYTSSGRLPGYAGNLDMNTITEEKWNTWITAQPAPVIKPLPLPLFSQRDSTWASEKLGTSSVTIGAYGCLITAVASLCKFYGKDTNPSKLNKDLITVNGYESGNLLRYDAVTTIYPDIVVDWNNFLSSPSNAVIDAALLKGKPVIVQVDYNTATSVLDQHWINVIGKDSMGYLIADPIDGQVAYLSRYAGKAYRMVVYDHKATDVVLFKAKVVCNALNVRSEPVYKADGSNIVDMLQNGNVMNVYEVSLNNWFRIGVNRWCSGSSSYVQKIEEPVVVPTEPSDAEKLSRLWEAHPELH